MSSICDSPRPRISSVNNSPASPRTIELHHRAFQQTATPQMLHPSGDSFVKQAVYGDETPVTTPTVPVHTKEDNQPKLFGLPLKYISLITLAVQNAALTIVMHYSRIITPPNRTYSASSAVLLNELLKGTISLTIALMRIDPDDRKSRSSVTTAPQPGRSEHSIFSKSKRIFAASPRPLQRFVARWRRLAREVFSTDCWKLSIPAILYVIQNNLQFVASSNLDIATFQVTYQMKILTTAAFSVVMLRKKLTTVKWLSLLGLALGVGIVQIQTGSASHTAVKVVEVIPEELAGNSSTAAVQEVAAHVMNPLKGFLAVSAACMTSGLAGVYFEMVLKGSQADLWVRNVQLSLFSLLPALVPIVFNSQSTPLSAFWYREIFKNFGGWAWATVSIQVFGGLVTAVVIKYSDNIMKGFATSLSIVISFLASVALFNFAITVPFVIGSSVVLAATWFYNAPDNKPSSNSGAVLEKDGDGYGLADLKIGVRRISTVPGSPVESDAPILGETNPRKRSPLPTPRTIANAFGRVVGGSSSQANSASNSPTQEHYPTPAGGVNGGPLGSPFSSAPPSRKPSHVNVTASGASQPMISRNTSVGGGFDSALLMAGGGVSSDVQLSMTKEERR